MDLPLRREATVGVLVLLAAATFIAGTMWLRGKSLSRTRGYQIEFSDVGNLKESSPVRISGVQAGTVNEIRLLAPGKVLVGIDLRPDIKVKKDAKAKIVTLTLAAGDAAVAFEPGSSAEELPEEMVIKGQVDPGLADLATAFRDRIDSAITGFRAIANPETADLLTRTLKSMQTTLSATQRTIQFYGDPRKGPTAELDRTLASYRRLSGRLDSTLSDPGLKRAIGRMDTLSTDLSRMTQALASTGGRLDSVLAKMERGEGTLGKFATDSSLYAEMRAASASLNSLLGELKKHPGKVPVTIKLF